MATTAYIRKKFNLTQKDIAEDFEIPLATIKNWDARDCMPIYIFNMLNEIYQSRIDIEHYLLPY